jgi:hypothetical protein
MGRYKFKERAFVGKTPNNRATAAKQPRQDHSPSTIDCDVKMPIRKDRQSLAACEKVVHRPKINRCPDVVNYPAPPAFSISAYKIYAVHALKKYKSNSQINVG